MDSTSYVRFQGAGLSLTNALVHILTQWAECQIVSPKPVHQVTISDLYVKVSGCYEKGDRFPVYFLFYLRVSASTKL